MSTTIEDLIKKTLDIIEPIAQLIRESNEKGELVVPVTIPRTLFSEFREKIANRYYNGDISEAVANLVQEAIKKEDKQALGSRAQ
jgi:hypothetical protein